MAHLGRNNTDKRHAPESPDAIMQDLGFRVMGITAPSPAVDALHLDHRVTILQNYRMALAGVTIADASMYLDENYEMQLVTLLNTPQ